MADNRLTATYRAVVHDTNDPENLHRVRLVVPSVFGPDAVSGWAWPLFPGGTVPALNSVLYAVFEAGDPNNPLYFNSSSQGGAGVSYGTASLVGAGSLAATPTANFSTLELPSDYGLMGWAHPISDLNSTNTLTTGVLVMVMMRMQNGGPLGHVDYGVVGAGGTLTAGQNLIGVYRVAAGTGTLIGFTGDQTTNFGSTGAFKASLSVQSGQSLNVAATDVLMLGFLGKGTTMPTLMRGSSQNFMTNYGLSAGSFRSCNSGSSLTALPTTVTMSGTTSSSGVWGGVSI